MDAKPPIMAGEFDEMVGLYLLEKEEEEKARQEQEALLRARE